MSLLNPYVPNLVPPPPPSGVSGIRALTGDGAPTATPDLPAGTTVYYWDYTNNLNYVWDQDAEDWHQIT